MRGAPDPLYVAARRVLLDALEALHDHRDAIVLVGAQAVYMHVGDADLAVAPFTTDGDLALDPRVLAGEPLIEVALGLAGFQPEQDTIGVWTMSLPVDGVSTPVAVDLLVPESLGGVGRRGARIPPHAKHAARKARGLEAALVDHDLHTLEALNPGDPRQLAMRVAGPAATDSREGPQDHRS